MPDIKHIHIGTLIAQRLKDKRLSYAEFARLINVDRTTVYNIVRSKSIDIERLLRIQQVLGYNFIEEVYLGKNAPHDTKPETIEIEIPASSLQSVGQHIGSLKIIITPRADEDGDDV